MPANTLKVDRATKWGNPFHQKDYEGREGAVEAYRTWMHGDSKDAAKVRAAAREELRGKNLGCWCPSTDRVTGMCCSRSPTANR